MSSLAVATASVVGVVIGQLTAGVPLASALRRRERERNKPRPTLPPPLAELDEWPEDRARYLLDIWDAPDVAWPEAAT